MRAIIQERYGEAENVLRLARPVGPRSATAKCPGVRCQAGRSQRAIARDLDIDRRKVKRIIDRAA